MSAFQQFSSLPVAQIAYTIAAMFFFIFGTHYATYRHCKRVGRRWSFFEGFVSLLPQFNFLEWCTLVGFYIATLISFALALGTA
jgi:hypothetical protein